MGPCREEGREAGLLARERCEKCPHCYREFTNLRHHINQQHIQVG